MATHESHEQIYTSLLSSTFSNCVENVALVGACLNIPKSIKHCKTEALFLGVKGNTQTHTDIGFG